MKPTPPHSPRPKPSGATGKTTTTPPTQPGVKPGAKPGAKQSAGGPRTDWDEVAGWYDQLVGESGSEYHRQVVLPGVVRLLALLPGQRAADVACGQGVLCRLLHERGVEATGVDAAASLVRLARERGPEAVRYHVADARNLLFLPPNHFHAAACVLAVQNIHPLPPVFEGVRRLLVPGGRLVIVMMHPCFRGPKETSWGWDQAAGAQYRRVDRYLLPRKAPIVTHPGRDAGKDGGAYTWTFHKPIEAYVKALRTAGLLIDAIEEWPSHKTSAPGPRAAAENTARKEIPMFMAIRAVKVSAAVPGAAGPEGVTAEGEDGGGP